MSTIGSSPGFDRTSLPVSLDGRMGLDAVRPHDGMYDGAQVEAEGALHLADAQASPVQLADAGEVVLNLPAWDGVDEGQRLLQGDAALGSELGQLDLASAADRAADAILFTLG